MLCDIKTKQNESKVHLNNSFCSFETTRLRIEDKMCSS